MEGRSKQQATIQLRMPFVAIFLIAIAAYLVFNLANFQFFPRSVRQELEKIGSSITNTTLRIPAERGLIYDRDGEPLAFNIVQYRLGVSPNLVSDPVGLRSDLAEILGMDEFELYRRIESDAVWEFITAPIAAEQGQAIAALDEISLSLEEIPRRFYPQGSLAGYVVGIVVDDGLTGTLGVEGAYNDTLAGQVLDLAVSNVPLDLPEERPPEQRGQDIVLTLDRDVQFWVETELQAAVENYGAFRGSIIVMDPRNGDVLALANYPSLDPNNFLEVKDPTLLQNPVVQETYEPGTVVQALTVAGALESGAITPFWTYNDGGQLQLGGRAIYNYYFQSFGTTDVASVLARESRVGAATIAMEMGGQDFYSALRAFGMGSYTGVGLFAEERGDLRVPGDPDWSEDRLALNAFGQGFEATPMQIITAFAAIANDGIMRQPRIVKQVISETGSEEAQPSTLRRVISEETAFIITGLLTNTVLQGAPQALLPGYTIAGKPGTAAIPTAIEIERGANTSIVSFVGFLPADDPQAVIMVKLDRPDEYFGYEVAAPVFRSVAERLVILLEIPDDNARRQLAAAAEASRL